MQNFVRRVMLLPLALMSLSLVSCSGDDGPAGVAYGSGGGTADGHATITISAEDWTVDEFYSPPDPFLGLDEMTTYRGKYSPAPTVLKNVGPGDRVVITLRFADPLIATRDVPQVYFFLTAGGGSVAGIVDPELTTTGNWPQTCDMAGYVLVNGTGGQMTSFYLSTCYTPTAGNVISRIVFAFTVPANAGNINITETPELPIGTIYWQAVYDGDHRGEDPPVTSG